MQVVAERDGGRALLVALSEPSNDVFDQTPAVVVNLRRQTVGPRSLLQGILARGYWTPFTGDPAPVLALVSSALEDGLTAAGRTFDEAKVRRYPKGTKERGREGGGRFAPKGETRTTAGLLATPSWLQSEARTPEEAFYKATRPRDAIAIARGWLLENGFNDEAAGNHVQVVKAMQDNYPDGYEFFLSLNDMHKEDFRRNVMQGDEYVPERLDMHNAIRASYLQDARVPEDGQQPMALFMAGGSGSGKSSMVGKQVNGIFTDGVVEAPEYAVYVNPDVIKELLPESIALKNGHDPRWAALSHEESSDIAAKLREDAEQAGFPMVIDGTGDAEGPSDRFPEGKFMGKVRAAENASYRTKIVFVDLPTEVALVRSDERALKTDRKISHEQIRGIHRNVTARHLEWRESANDWEVWANDDEDAGGRRMIAQRAAGGPIEIIDRERYAQMEAKANG